jgi:GT2 family glycosyltransferase
MRTGSSDLADASRESIFEAVGDGADVTLVRGLGNLGDELIWAGTRQLFAGRPYREIGLDELPATRGAVGVLMGGGAFARAYHEYMPQVLAIAELCFDRVVVLPSSFDVSVDVVREALVRTRATVFARERESLEAIRGLCDARLGLDGGFFFDLAPYAHEGSGVLHAFRTDLEAPGDAVLPPDNDDISVTAGSLDAWLHRIAGAEEIHTDRAHVMIAGALLGKRVAYAASTFKLDAIAEYALDGLPVRRIAPPAPTGPARRAVAGRAAPLPARVTAAVLVHDRIDAALDTLDSLLAHSDADVLVLDNASSDRNRRRLAAAVEGNRRVRLVAMDRNLGCAGGRRHAVALVDTEHVLFLDSDAVVTAGAVDALLAELDGHPEAVGATALVVGPDGATQHCGGTTVLRHELIEFWATYAGDDPARVAGRPSERCDWLPGTAALIRTDTLREHPIDDGMARYYEDNEWSHRVGRAVPNAFRAVPAAVVHHRNVERTFHRHDLRTRCMAVGFLAALARFHALHDLVPGGDLFRIVPSLAAPDGTYDIVSARLLLTVLSSIGPDRFVREWSRGGLDPILGVGRWAADDTVHAERARHRAERVELEEHVRRLQVRVGDR